MPEFPSPTVGDAHETGTSGTDSPDDAKWSQIDALLEDLPPGIPILPPEDAGNFEKYTHRPRRVYTPGEGAKDCVRALERHDTVLCKSFREEIDTLLIFAGLFCAVVTAFIVQSTQWLQTDPNEVLVALLAQIAGSRNTTLPVPTFAGFPITEAVRINICWFLALVLSLSAALVAIMSKQWIREFESNVGLNPQQFLSVHQTKLEGLSQWGVGGIISVLPLILQAAVGLFSVGLVDLLWQIHIVVAAIVSVPIIVAFLFYVITTVLPAIQQIDAAFSGRSSYLEQLSECPYKSPQARLAFPVYKFYLWMKSVVVSGVFYLVYLLSLARYHLAARFLPQLQISRPMFHRRFKRLDLSVPSWDGISLRFTNRLDAINNRQPLSIYRSLRWIHLNLDDGEIRESIWHCLWERATAAGAEDTSEVTAHRRGFSHVEHGGCDLPRVGLRALALSYLFRTQAPRLFIVEACIQNLSLMDCASAEYLTNRMITGLHPIGK